MEKYNTGTKTNIKQSNNMSYVVNHAKDIILLNVMQTIIHSEQTNKHGHFL